ncbi:MAG: clostripain-related cysteine peptidase [Aggregatilineales bacterium]
MAQDTEASWTVMHYMAMDNDLEPYIYNDLSEMMAAGSTDDVNIVVQVDRAENYSTRFDDWTDTRRFYLMQQSQPEYSFEDKVDEVIAFFFEQETGDSREDILAELATFRGLNPVLIEAALLQIGLSETRPDEIETIFRNLSLNVSIMPEAIESPGEVNMGASETLVDFVLWAMENYPAEQYMLMIGSHGAGWQGIGPDYGDDDDTLFLPEIDAALTEIRERSGVDKLDIVGFDACLMGQLEVYETLTPHTDYILAAEEVIPGFGMAYTAPLIALAENPEMGATTLGENFINAYIDYYADLDIKKVDLHLIDSSGIAGVRNSLAAFEEVAAVDTVSALASLGSARNNAQVFGASVVENGSLRSSVDLVHFMELLGVQLDISDDLSLAAEDVILASNLAVAYSRADDNLPGARGISIYFPLNTRSYEASGFNEIYPGLIPAEMSGWLNFLDNLHTTTDSALNADNLSINISDVLTIDETGSIHDNPTLVFETDGQGIASLDFYAVNELSDGTLLMIDSAPLVFESILEDGTVVREYPSGATTSEFRWNVDMPVLSDGENFSQAILWQESAAATQGSVEGTYINSRDGTETPASLIFDLNTFELSTVLGVAENAEGSAIFQIQTLPGDRFVPSRYVFDENDNLLTVPSPFDLTFGATPFTFEFRPVPSGNYQLTMILEDLAGNSAIASSAFAVDNDGLDATFRGFKDNISGLNFLYPWGWTDPVYFELQDGSEQIAVEDPESTLAIYVDVYDYQTPENMLEFAFQYIGGLENAVVGEAQVFEGIENLYYFEYNYTRNDEARSGAIASLYSPVTGKSYTLDVDGTALQAEDVAQVFVDMVASLRFFPTVE